MLRDDDGRAGGVPAADPQDTELLQAFGTIMQMTERHHPAMMQFIYGVACKHRDDGSASADDLAFIREYEAGEFVLVPMR
jgi:hypothetical protein